MHLRFLPAGMVREKLLKILRSGRAGYTNETFSNSISPLT